MKNVSLYFMIILSIMPFQSILPADNSMTEEENAFFVQFAQDYQECQKQKPIDTSYILTAKSVQELSTIITTTSQPLVVFIGAQWCEFCTYFKPIFDSVSYAYKNDFKFVYIEYENISEIKKDLAIDGVPVLLFCHNGVVFEKIEGIYLKSQLDAIMQQIKKDYVS